MDTAALSRAPSPSTPQIAAGGDSGARKPAAERTELPAEKTVNTAEKVEKPTDRKAEAASGKASEAPPKEDAPRVDSRTVLDSETDTLLFQMVEEVTGAVKLQIPDDTLLRVREYARDQFQSGLEGDSPQTGTSLDSAGNVKADRTQKTV